MSGGTRQGAGGLPLGHWYIVVPTDARFKPWPPHGPFRSKGDAYQFLERWRYARLDDLSTAGRQDGIIKGPFKRKADALAAWNLQIRAV